MFDSKPQVVVKFTTRELTVRCAYMFANLYEIWSNSASICIHVSRPCGDWIDQQICRTCSYLYQEGLCLYAAGFLIVDFFPFRVFLQIKFGNIC